MAQRIVQEKQRMISELEMHLFIVLVFLGVMFGPRILIRLVKGRET